MRDQQAIGEVLLHGFAHKFATTADDEEFVGVGFGVGFFAISMVCIKSPAMWQPGKSPFFNCGDYNIGAIR